MWGWGLGQDESLSEDSWCNRLPDTGDCAKSKPISPVYGSGPANAAQPASGTDIPTAHPISTVDPKYPKEARKQKRQGTVVLRVKIGEDGKVQDLSVVSGDPDFAAAATQAVKKWRFQPSFGRRKADRGGTERDSELYT